MLPMPKSDWWRKLQNASLTFYSNDGSRVAVRLSETQVIAIILLLGIDFESQSESIAYSDDALLHFMQMKGNPFKLDIIDEAESKKA